MTEQRQLLSCWCCPEHQLGQLMIPVHRTLKDSVPGLCLYGASLTKAGSGRGLLVCYAFTGSLKSIPQTSRRGQVLLTHPAMLVPLQLGVGRGFSDAQDITASHEPPVLSSFLLPANFRGASKSKVAAIGQGGRCLMLHGAG